jgi:hypothetical protein
MERESGYLVVRRKGVEGAVEGGLLTFGIVILNWVLEVTFFEMFTVAV